MIIIDGTGKGNQLKIDDNNRARTQAITETETIHAVELGDAYNINTGSISYTAAGSMLYVKNNEDRDLVVDAIAVGLGNGTVSVPS